MLLADEEGAEGHSLLSSQGTVRSSPSCCSTRRLCEAPVSKKMWGVRREAGPGQLDSPWIPLRVLVSSRRETQYLVNNSNFIFPHVWSVRGCLLWSRVSPVAPISKQEEAEVCG